jgi:hypothetical protein
MMDWATLSETIQRGEWQKFTRTREVLAAYVAFKRKGLKLNLEWGNKEHIFRANEYRYDLSPEIKHYVLWHKRELEIDAYKAIIEKEYLLDKPFLIWKNPPEGRSVPDISHCHVFWR